MRVSFTASQQSTLGVEWEVALVDADSLELSARAPEVLTALGAPDTPSFKPEFCQHIVELISTVHHDVSGAIDELAELSARLRTVTDPLGLEVLATGTHPFSLAADAVVTPAPRYLGIRERVGWWAQRLVICGTHVHIGVAHRDKALPITHGLTRYLPHLLALSASSPFWEGEDTTYASQRTMLFQQLPSAGLPPTVHTWVEYERYFTQLRELGLVSEANDIRWDVRPAPHFGTVENRILDGIPTLAEVGALVALTQCLVESQARELEWGHAPDVLDPWLVRENKWRAARFGLDADVIVPGRHGTERPLREEVLGLADRLAPVAGDLGCARELEFLESIVRHGASYERQRALHRATGDLPSVVRAVVAETRSGAPAWTAGPDGLTSES